MLEIESKIPIGQKNEIRVLEISETALKLWTKSRLGLGKVGAISTKQKSKDQSNLLDGPSSM